MHSFTVFTAACNRPNELCRLYSSLTRQTNKDFVWLIVDDSTGEGVGSVVDAFILEGKIEIDYHKQEHRGKYWAQKRGFSLVETPYMLDVDDDDELREDCIEVLLKEWKKIEEEGKSEVGVICGRIVYEDRQPVDYFNGRPFFDTDFIEIEWTNNQPCDNLISRKLDVIKNVDIFNIEGEWLANQVALVREFVLWNRVARKYKSRYINYPLMICHTDTSNRLSNSVFGKQKCIDYVFSNRVFLNELDDRLWDNPKGVVKYVAEYVACGAALGLPPTTLVKKINNWVLKTIGVFLWPAALLVGGFIRIKNFK